MVEYVSIKADSDDIRDSLCGRHLTNHHMCAARRHQSANLSSNQLGHLSFPAKPDTFALTAGCRHNGMQHLTSMFYRNAGLLGMACRPLRVLPHCSVVDRRGSDP